MNYVFCSFFRILDITMLCIEGRWYYGHYNVREGMTTMGKTGEYLDVPNEVQLERCVYYVARKST